MYLIFDFQVVGELLLLRDHVEGADGGGGGEEDRHVHHDHLGEAHVVAHDHRREHEAGEQHHQRVGEVRGEVEGGLHLLAPGERRGEDPRQQLLAHLHRALGPALLLRLEGVHLDRQLGGGDEVRQVHEPPAPQLRPVGEVEVLGEGVVLPAPRVRDHRAAPDARGAVEVEEAAGAAARPVLHDEVPVEHDRLHFGEQRVVAVDVAPARLDHPDLRVGEVAEGLLEDVGRGHEVGVEDEDELAGGGAQAGVEGARLVAGAVGAVQVVDVEAELAVVLDGAARDRGRLVGRVVEDLDLEPVLRDSGSRRPTRAGGRARTSR